MRFRRVITLTLAWAMIALAIPTVAVAAPPGPATGSETFVCPSVSLNNSNGMWVIGGHGAYSVLVPTRGHTGMPMDKVFVKHKTARAMEAQTTAGFGLYESYFSYPNYVSQSGEMAMLLAEGIVKLETLGAAVPMDWMEGDILSVMDTMDGTYTVMNMGNMMAMPMVPKGSLVLDVPIPIYSALFW